MLVNVNILLTSSEEKTWQIIQHFFGGAAELAAESADLRLAGFLRAINTTMFPISAMYEIICRAWSIMASWKHEWNQPHQKRQHSQSIRWTVRYVFLSNLCVSTQYFDSLCGNEQIHLCHRLRLSFRCLDIIQMHIYNTICCCISHVNTIKLDF